MKKINAQREKIIILCLGVILACSVNVFAFDIKEYFPLNQGNKSVYSNTIGGKHEITFEIDGKETFNNVEAAKILNIDPFLKERGFRYLAADVEGLKIYKVSDNGDYILFNPPLMMFPNSALSEEKKYSSVMTSYSGNGLESFDMKVANNISLKSVDEIVGVPAGEFKNCLKYAVVTEVNEKGRTIKNDCNVWLAPGVGEVKRECVKTTYDSEGKEEGPGIPESVELISFTVVGNK